MQKQLLTYDKEKFYLNSEEFYLAVGDIHYFRIHPSDWEHRLNLAKDFGLTAIQVYAPWHQHEKEKGVFDFSGILDLAAFLETAQRVDLKVMLRPGPYICSELDLGGMPAWLLRDKDMKFRCSHPAFLAAVSEYFKVLCKVFVPYLSTNGGPIIAVCIENEYGTYGNDKVYLKELRQMLENGGVDVPFYTTDGAVRAMIYNGTTDDSFVGLNFRARVEDCSHPLNAYADLLPNLPKFAGELWSGRSQQWTKEFSYRNPKEVADTYKLLLENGVQVSFYMFSGGTNFGFTSGAIYGHSYADDYKLPSRFLPYATSYDCDSLISEDGNLTEKYFLCRDILDEYLGKAKRPHTYNKKPTQAFEVKLCESADLFENLENLAVCEKETLEPLTMEELNQNFGYVLYNVKVAPGKYTGPLNLSYVNDKANVFVNGEYKGGYLRDGENTPIILTNDENGMDVNILVENLGRYSNHKTYTEKKGIVGNVSIYSNWFNWKQWSLPLDDISALQYSLFSGKKANMPTFLRGKFDAKAGVDTFLLTDGFSHGNVWINGFNIGRYWDKGPQRTLYVPGGLLKEKDNVIEIFDVKYDGKKQIVSFIDHSILEGNN
ncbi:MAG: beta-galactosidase [Clostridia bacterium]|nr:beta-galactosidase [Clostridia bacterium]